MKVSRRSFATGLALSSLAAGQPQAPPQEQSSANPKENATAFEPHFFDPHQLQTVALIADLIIPRTDTPGARDALVHEHLDAILAASTEPVQSRFLSGLWWLDGYCLRSNGVPFRELAVREQMPLLVRLDQTTHSESKPGRDFVQLAKAWTARIYYSTEAGHLELNKQIQIPSSYVEPCES